MAEFAKGGFVPSARWLDENYPVVVSTPRYPPGDSIGRAEGSEAARNEPQPPDGVIRWCADRGYALDEWQEAWIRRWWGVK